MFNLKKGSLCDLVSGIHPQYFCLTAALGLEFLLMAFRGYGFYFMENYIIIPTMLFLGMAFSTGISPAARRQLWLSLGMVFWFFIAQTLHYLFDMEVRNVGLFTSIYLLAFPFAALTVDGVKQWGLKLAAAACIGASLVMVGFTCLLSLDLLPGFLQAHISWDGARLQAFWHPNICAVILMMGISFCLYLAIGLKKKLVKGLFLFLAVVFFFTMSLTNSRTSIFMACIMVAGTLFCCIYNGSWKRFALGAAAALAAIAILFTAASTIFQTHNDLLIESYLQQDASISVSDEESPLVINAETGEVKLKTEAVQSSLAQNLGSLNGRTGIWSTALKILKTDTRVMLWGVDNSDSLFALYHSFAAAHAHNSWLETALCLGLPGLVFTLVFTVLAVFCIWTTFWGKDIPLEQKVIAVLALCLLGAGILEPYLFFSDIFYHYTDFIFFLCLGYLIHWRSKAA